MECQKENIHGDTIGLQFETSSLDYIIVKDYNINIDLNMMRIMVINVTYISLLNNTQANEKDCILNLCLFFILYSLQTIVFYIKMFMA